MKEATDSSYIADYALTVTGKGQTDKTTLRLPAEARYETVKDAFWSNTYVIATVENNTDTIYYDYSAVFAIKDKDGKLLYVTDTTPYDVGLFPGSKMEIRCRVDSGFVDYMEANSIQPATVDIIVYVEINK